MDILLVGFLIAGGILAMLLAVRVMMYLSRIAWRMAHWDDFDG